MRTKNDVAQDLKDLDAQEAKLNVIDFVLGRESQWKLTVEVGNQPEIPLDIPAEVVKPYILQRQTNVQGKIDAIKARLGIE